MPLALSFEELLGYTSDERNKWERWFHAQPAAALHAGVQRDGRFPDVWKLMDHIFLVEKRHTQRLKRESPLTEQTGIAPDDVSALFEFARSVRKELADFISRATDMDLSRIIELKFPGYSGSFTARKLAFHILFHEIRHWAQIATAVRNAGFAPPGSHDLLFTQALE